MWLTAVIVTIATAVMTGVIGFDQLEYSKYGFIMYCPCMGRFGNQADMFLGALAFAKSLDRTLVLPSWVEYESNNPRSIQVPFDHYFMVEPLQSYHRVMTMERFMSELAPTIWPPGKRIAFCYRARPAFDGADDGGCNAKDGNPFDSFWDTYNVDFDSSEYFAPLDFDTRNDIMMNDWRERFPAYRFPVLAFTGAPGGFPILQPHTILHQYLHWSEFIKTKVDEFVSKNIPPGTSFLGIHLRNGQDWSIACGRLTGDLTKRNMFASAQCLGYSFDQLPLPVDTTDLAGEGEWSEKGVLDNKTASEICFPSKSTILIQVRAVIKAMGDNVSTVFIATDDDPMVRDLRNTLGDKAWLERVFYNGWIHRCQLLPAVLQHRWVAWENVRVIEHKPWSVHMDLALLARADHFIGGQQSIIIIGFLPYGRFPDGSQQSSIDETRA